MKLKRPHRPLSPAVTLVEALLVVVLFAVIAGLAYQNYWRATENARIKGAWSMLRLIDGAQKAYERDSGAGFAANIADLVANGYLDDPDVGQTDWNYGVLTDATQATARRTSGRCAFETLTRVYDTGKETSSFVNCGL